MRYLVVFLIPFSVYSQTLDEKKAEIFAFNHTPLLMEECGYKFKNVYSTEFEEKFLNSERINCLHSKIPKVTTIVEGHETKVSAKAAARSNIKNRDCSTQPGILQDLCYLNQ
jgi:hypothetical protein